MSVVFNAATAANVSILQTTNSLFQIAQKRVATGKAIFGAADDAARYRMSETLLSRTRQLTMLNNNISLTIQTLKSTDDALTSMISDLEKARNLTVKAQSEGTASQRAISSQANINITSNIASIAVGDIFSITSDNGRNFTYTVSTTSTTWQNVGDALNSANIGVQIEYVPGSGNNQHALKFVSTDGRDFTFDARTSQTFMGPLAHGNWSANTGGQTAMSQNANAQALFANGATGNAAVAPGVGETGWTVSFGGRIMSMANVTSTTTVASGSSLSFTDGDGQVRSLSYSANTTVATVIADINAMNCGVAAQLTNKTASGTTMNLDLRSTRGKPLTIHMATGDFSSAATATVRFATGTNFDAPLSTNNALRLDYGRQYDNLLNNVIQKASNNAAQLGRNLLNGQGLGVILDEFASSNSITITGTTVSSAWLGTGQAGSTWTSDTNIQNSGAQALDARKKLIDLQTQFSTFANYMQERFDSNKIYAEAMKSSGDDLVAADVAEESAKLTALQTQQQFAVQAFAAGSQAAQALLRLLG